MADNIPNEAIIATIRRVSAALLESSDHLTELDQAMGDGDTGITLTKVANALIEYVDTTPMEDVGVFLAGAGMATNRAAPSTLGTLTATALIAAGKAAKGRTSITTRDVVMMFDDAVAAIEMRGKAQLGDKTLVDAMFPASMAFGSAIDAGLPMSLAGGQALAAAEHGRDTVTPLRSRIGRASWLGERTEGRVDPGCEAFVIVLTAIVNGQAWEN
jgi:dihydroxyacetone kinase